MEIIEQKFIFAQVLKIPYIMYQLLFSSVQDNKLPRTLLNTRAFLTNHIFDQVIISLGTAVQVMAI